MNVNGLESFWKYAWIICLSLLAVIRIYYRWKSQTLFLKGSKYTENIAANLFRWFLILLMAFSLLAQWYLLDYFPWLVLPVGMFPRWIGLLISLTALTLLWRAHQTLGKSFNMDIEKSGQAQLVRSGPYRWVRHPIYLAYFLFFFGGLLVSGNWLFFLSTESVIVYLMTIRCQKEESYLTSVYGEDYRVYMNTTGRFIPNVKPIWQSLRRGIIRIFG